MSNSDQAAQCDNVDEADPGHNIVEGPPAAGCVEDGERWAQMHKLLVIIYLSILT